MFSDPLKRHEAVTFYIGHAGEVRSNAYKAHWTSVDTKILETDLGDEPSHLYTLK